MNASTRPSLSLRKKLAFAFIPCVVFFAAAELLLRLIDYQSPSADPYASFVTRSSLFEEGVDGVMFTAKKRTRLFHPIGFKKNKDPDAIRYFTVGGSTTYGYHLKAPLFDCYCMRLSNQMQQEYSVPIEPINCGGVAYASYRLAPIVDETLNYSPDFIILMTGNNEFLEPRYYEEIFENTSPGQRLLQVSRFIQSLNDLGYAVGLTKSDDGIGEWKGQYVVRDETEIQHTLDHYTVNLTRMVTACREKNVPLILCTVPTNLRDWPPFVSEPAAGTSQEEFDELVKEAQALLDQKKYDECQQQCEKLVKKHPRGAIFHYLIAKCLDGQGNAKAALESYIQARDKDAFPQRALSSFNDTVRQIAEENNVRLLDTEKLFIENSEAGIPGNSLFLDNCHPNNKGHQLITDALMKFVREIKPR
ncbi:MAG: hypothetical protein CMJ78_19355 [Planctomycetaceae bacterium]|nr:hypothetical protein [Planctomycetaceae bacterium]